MNDRYIVAALGARDYYQVPVALHEAGRLECHLTDFYLPNFLWGVIKKRFARDLPSSKVRSSIVLFVLAQVVRRRGFERFGRSVDRLFGIWAARQCRRYGCNAIVYSYYVEGFVEYCRRAGWRPRHLLTFQVHPSPWTINKILDSDAAESLEKLGAKFQPDLEASYDEASSNSYREAVAFTDGVIAASTFTVRSLDIPAGQGRHVYIAPYGSKFESDGVCVGSALETVVGGFKGGKIKLLTVSQLSQRKGLHWAFAALSRSSIAADVDWLVVTSKVDEGVRSLAPGCVRFIGKVGEAELFSLYKSADCFVLPSLIEGYGLVYIESLSAGTPVMYTRNTGVVDISQGASVGVELDLERLGESFIEALRSISKDSGWRDRYSESCIRVAERTTWARFRSCVVEALASRG